MKNKVLNEKISKIVINYLMRLKNKLRIIKKQQ